MPLLCVDRSLVLRRLLGAVFALYSAVALAADDGVSGRDTGAVALPAFPRPAGLLPVPLDLPDFHFKLSIDPASLSVENGVVRYTVVLTSPSGARNVFYEGVNCITGRYTRYAYGASDGRFARFPDIRWKRIFDIGDGRYRYQFYNFFLCSPTAGALPRHQILQRIRYQSR